MNNRYFKYLFRGWFIGVLTLSLFSCQKNWYDIKSDKSLTVPSTLQDLECLLDDYNTMNDHSPGLGEVGSDGHYFPPTIWSTFSRASFNNERNASQWSYTLPYLSVDDWNLNYKKIFVSNLVLDGLNKITPKNPAEQQQYNQIKGNALFHKAKNYYDLAQLYAPVYNAGTAGKDLGIPLKDGIDVTKRSIRSSVEETYQEIIADLAASVNLLPSTPASRNRASKSSAFGLLGRTYLTMQDYQHALMYADSSLKIYNELMDFNTLSPSSPTLGLFNQEVLFSSLMKVYVTTMPLYLYSFVDSLLYASYDSNDLRKSIFFMQNADGTISFKGMYSKYGNLFAGIATDEVYLIRAECYARTGNMGLALKDLNTLLQSRWNNTVAYSPVTAVNADEALAKILTERNKELLLRGLRWADLRRLNLDDRFKRTLTRIVGTQTYTLEPNSYKYTFPIPNDEITLSGILQNTGW